MTTNKPEAAHLADARAEFEKWASTHFFLQEEDTIVDDSYEYISVDMQLAWEAWYASSAAPDVAKLVEALERFVEAWTDCQQQPVHAEEFEILTDICEDSLKALAAHRKQGGGK